MVQQAGGGGAQADNSYQPLWIVALIAFVGFAIWLAFSEPLKAAFLAWRKYQLIALDAVLSGFGSEAVKEARAWAEFATPQQLTMPIAKWLSESTGEYYRYLYAPILGFYAWRIFFKNPLARYRKKYTLKTLAAQEQQNWPQIRSVIRFDLVAEDLETGPWAMAMTPMQFAKKYRLITVTYAPQGSLFAKNKGPEFQVVLNRNRAERAFALQLGRPFRGIEALMIQRKAILAVLVSRACRDSQASKSLALQLASSAASGKLNTNGVDGLLKKHYQSRLIQEKVAIHAYELPLFISLMQLAREDGVVASADFLWVKPIDRSLWLTLNNAGRQTPGAEVAGIFNHWYHECELKRPLSVPVVDACVDALDIALKEVIYVPDDQEKDEIMARAQQQAREQQA